MEIEKIKHKLKNEDHRGFLWFKEYEFDKVRIYRDKQGDITSEVPFTQHAYLISLKKQAVWLTPQQLFDLKDMLMEGV